MLHIILAAIQVKALFCFWGFWSFRDIISNLTSLVVCDVICLQFPLILLIPLINSVLMFLSCPVSSSKSTTCVRIQGTFQTFLASDSKSQQGAVI